MNPLLRPEDAHNPRYREEHVYLHDSTLKKNRVATRFNNFFLRDLSEWNRYEEVLHKYSQRAN